MPRRKFVTAERLNQIRDGKRLSIAGLVLIRQRPGSAKGVVFITIEDETGVANLVVWPDVFARQRKIVMGARLMAVHGIVQRDPDSNVIHVVARRLEDHTHMLGHLSEEVMPSTLSQGDGAGSLAGARFAAIRATSKLFPKAAISIKCVPNFCHKIPISQHDEDNFDQDRSWPLGLPQWPFRQARKHRSKGCGATPAAPRSSPSRRAGRCCAARSCGPPRAASAKSPPMRRKWSGPPCSPM